MSEKNKVPSTRPSENLTVSNPNGSVERGGSNSLPTFKNPPPPPPKKK